MDRPRTTATGRIRGAAAVAGPPPFADDEAGRDNVSNAPELAFPKEERQRVLPRPGRSIMIKRHRTTTILAGLAAGMLLAGTTLANERQTSGVVTGMSLERLERLDEHFHRYVDDGVISGVVTYIVRRGQVVHQDAYGLADIAANRPMSQDTYFYVYSMTKPVTSVALLILYEEGKFQLDDPIANYLPELADLKLYVGDDENGNMILKDP